MFKIIKKLFHIRGSETATVAPRVPKVVSAGPVANGFKNPEAAPGVEVASLSLRAILERLPADLKATVGQMPSEDVRVILPVNAIMKQLPSGSVKMSLGSLYRQAPNGTFRRANVEDKRMIEVPLAEIFKTINPGRLHRRNDQRKYDVPDDVQGLFANGGSQNGAPQPAFTRPAPEPVAEPAPEPPKPLRMPGSPAPAPQATGVRPSANGNGTYHPPVSAPVPVAPAETQSANDLNLTGELSLLLVEIGATWPENIRAELSVLAGDTKIVLPVADVSAGLQKGRVAFTWEQIRSWLNPQTDAAINIPDETVLVLPLKIVAPAFVAATGAKKRQSSQSLNQALPDFFGPSAGRTPAAPPAPSPAMREPEVRLEPPAPSAFAPPPAPVPLDETASIPVIPSAPAPTLKLIAEEPPVEAPVSAPVPVAPTAVPIRVQSTSAVPRDLASLFSKPGKTDWTPNELVRLTCELPGVIGAVVALEEGLVVAQKLPEGLSSETFAAFMPQIFSRLDKYTGEMQLGDTEEITINTAGGPCQFFRRGKLFFATLGRSGEPLPAGLHLVAIELGNQNS